MFSCEMVKSIYLSRFVTSLINVSFQTWIGIKPKHVFSLSGQGSEMSLQTGRLLLNKSNHCAVVIVLLIDSEYCSLKKKITASESLSLFDRICLDYAILWYTCVDWQQR